MRAKLAVTTFALLMGMAGGSACAGVAPDIALRDARSSDASTYTFENDCGGGKMYAARIYITGHRFDRLTISGGGTSRELRDGIAIARLGGNDLYSVHLACSPTGAVFRFQILQADGSFITQAIVIKADEGIRVYPESRVLKWPLK